MFGRRTRFSQVALVAMMIAGSAQASHAQAALDDLEMAHVAVVASQIDIAYAHLALAFSTNSEVRRFAETMIRDHEAVNAQVAALAARLKVTARDNPMSQALLAAAVQEKNRLSQLRGADFDLAYAQNELSYHRKVNGAVADQFIPNAQNRDVKAAFQGALTIFRGHEQHAAALVQALGGR